MLFVRSLLALVAGAVAAGLLVAAVEAAGHALFPLPPFDPADPDAVRAAVAAAPPGALLSVLVAWGVGAFAGGRVASRLAPRAPAAHGLAVGALILLGAAANLAALPHPAWFAAAGPLLIIAAAFAGAARRGA